MALEESDEIPMLARGRRRRDHVLPVLACGRSTRDHVFVELSTASPPLDAELSSSGITTQRHSHFFSAPLQQSCTISGRNENGLVRGSMAGKRAAAAGAPAAANIPSILATGNRFYSGPIVVQNESLSSSTEPVVPVHSVRRRRQNNSNGHEHLLRSGPLGKCDDPFCTTCPMFTKKEEMAATLPRMRPFPDTQENLWVLDKIKWFFGHVYSFGCTHMPGVMNPHTKRVQQWNKLFLISCLLAIFVDPLFFFILSVNDHYKCIYFNMTFAKVITVLRSMTDLVYLVHMLLQFRLAYVGPDSGIGLIDDPKEILKHYLFGWFWLDFVVVLPLPQIIMWVIIPKISGMANAANFAKNLLRGIILVQYIPRMLRFAPLLAGNSPTGFIFETAKANFLINLFLFLLVAHVVGSCWYLFGLQRVNQCLRIACLNATISGCNPEFLDCGTGENITEKMKFASQLWKDWIDNANASQCFSQNSSVFEFGIYTTAVSVVVSRSYVEKYVYSLFWGFQQISTLAGNQAPSMFVGEILFVLGVVILGLLLTVLLISNMQNFLISLNQRRVDMQLRRYDVECWMARRQLPEEFRKKIRQAERLRWAANKGLDEDELLRSLPEDIEKEIRRALCLDLIKKVRLFTFMRQQVLDAICERLHQDLYIEGTIILRKNYPIEKMHFFVKGTLQLVEEDECARPLESKFCGEELLIWCLEKQSSTDQVRPTKAHHAESTTTVKCVENVEAFTLSAKDLQEVTDLYSDLLRNKVVQGALRYESSYWRKQAAMMIQVKWRYYRRRSNLR